MNDVDHLAQALDACLEQAGAAGGDAHAALAACPEVADDLAPLLALASALGARPIPGPTPAFRARLRADLAAAAPPRSLAARATARSTTDVVHALDVGLAELRAGLDVDDVLARHPGHEADIEPLLALAADLAALQPIPAPSDDFRRRLAADLAAAPVPRSVAVRAAPSGLGWPRRLWRSTAFMAASAATVVLFLTAGVTYASANALPGDALYPVKRLAEQAQGWLARTDDVDRHLALADRRLAEALAVPGAAGALLSDFSREVTAALVAADGRMAAGEPRARVAPPVLQWLLGARGRLVDGRPKLPPTAWRGALGLVDEAIAALRSAGPLTVAPVPRLARVDGERVSPARDGAVARVRPAARLVAAGDRSPTAGARGRAALAPAPSPSTSRPALAAAPPMAAGVPVAPPAATATPVAPTEAPAAAPGRRPSGAEDPDPPTVAPTPAAPIVVVPSDTPTASPSETATSAPSPTIVPTATNVPPTIVSVACTPQKLEGYGEATCTVVADDPEHGALSYAWFVSPLHGELKTPDQAETKLQVWPPGSGYEPRPITIQITVTDPAGNAAQGKTEVIVVPVLDQG